MQKIIFHITCRHYLQLHVCNCIEILCFQNALALVKGVPLEDLNHKHALAMRQYALAVLAKEGQKPGAQRTVCDLESCCKPGFHSKWISCSVCGRWLHFKCVGLSIAPSGEYTCPVCIAQYE